jgi:hypothetical protein
MMLEKTRQTFEGKVNFSCESVEEREHIYNLASQVKDTIGDGNPNRVSKKDMLNEVFNFYLRNNTSQENFDEPGDYIPFADTSFTKCDEKEDTSQHLFIASTSAIDHLIRRITNHRILCNSLVKIKTCKLLGHVAYCKLQCDNKHDISWSSSPYIGDKYLGNLRMAHGYYVSGILPNQYQRFCQAASIEL